jgi:hypothetical protein
MDTTLTPKRNKTMKPSRTKSKNDNFATIEFEFKNSFEPAKNESTDPELKLLKLGRENPVSGPEDNGAGAASGPDAGAGAFAPLDPEESDPNSPPEPEPEPLFELGPNMINDFYYYYIIIYIIIINININININIIIHNN